MYLWMLSGTENSTVRDGTLQQSYKSGSSSFVSHVLSLHFISVGLFPGPDWSLPLTHFVSGDIISGYLLCNLFFAPFSFSTQCCHIFFPFCLMLLSSVISISYLILPSIVVITLLSLQKLDLVPPFFPSPHNISQLYVFIHLTTLSPNKLGCCWDGYYYMGCGTLQ